MEDLKWSDYWEQQGYDKYLAAYHAYKGTFTGSEFTDPKTSIKWFRCDNQPGRGIRKFYSFRMVGRTLFCSPRKNSNN
jgi:hypothetical protein